MTPNNVSKITITSAGCGPQPLQWEVSLPSVPFLPSRLYASAREETAPDARITMLRKVKRRDTTVTPLEMMAILREMGG